MNYIVLDTETANTLEEPLAYDLGWAVVDENGNVLKTASFAIAEIFLDTELMSTAYFAEKVPQYWGDIKNGNRVLARLNTIYWAFCHDCKEYEVKQCFAHNSHFDDLSLKLTVRLVTGSRRRYFLPRYVTLCDTLAMSREVFSHNAEYRHFCKVNNYVTSRNAPRLTAEIIYRYISGNDNFAEEHQGLADVLIEKDILMECLKRGAQVVG